MDCRHLAVRTLVAAMTLGAGVAAAAPSIQVNPVALDFGTVPVGREAPPRQLTLSNVGDAPLHVTDIEVLDNDNGAQAVAYPVKSFPLLPLTIDVNKSASLDIVFGPGLAMPYGLAWIEIRSDDPMSPLVRVPLSGSGVNVRMLVDRTTFGFGDAVVGTTVGPTPIFTLFNEGLQGAVPIDVSSLTVDSMAFTIDQAGPLQLAAQQSLAVNGTFSPTAIGTFNGRVEVRVGGVPAAWVNLSGTGVSPVRDASPSAGDMADAPRCTVGRCAGGCACSTVRRRGSVAGPLALLFLVALLRRCSMRSLARRRS